MSHADLEHLVHKRAHPELRTDNLDTYCKHSEVSSSTTLSSQTDLMSNPPLIQTVYLRSVPSSRAPSAARSTL